MAWTTPQGKHVKNSGLSEGAPVKKDGYAKGPVPESMIGGKCGKCEGRGYSGPTVAYPEKP